MKGRIPGEFIKHLPCPKCGSSDALSLYRKHDGTIEAHCFSCESHWFNYNSNDNNNNNSIITKERRGNLLDVVINSIPARHINIETAQKFNYGWATMHGKPVQVAQYYNKNGTLVAQKTRDKDKNFLWLGDSSSIMLFGQQAQTSGGKRLVITEGELDALSVSQAFDNSWQVVSIPSGAGSASKSILENLEFVESFSEVVLAFDNDKAGQEGIKKVAPLLSLGKVKIVNWAPFKDANECLMKKGKEEVRKHIWNASSYRPDGLITGPEVDILAFKKTPIKGFNTGFPIFDTKCRGIRKQEITVVTAGSGIGKSTFSKEITMNLLKNYPHLKIGIMALEEGLSKTTASLVAIDHNIPLASLEENPELLPDEEYLATKAKYFDRLIFDDHFGSLDSNRLLEKLRYMVVGFGVDFIIFDHISIAVSGIEGGDERRIIDNLMTNIRSLVQNTGVGVVMISHLKITSEPHEEGGKVSINHLRGSGGIKQLSDIIIALERNQLGKESNITDLKVLKNRFNGVLGYMDVLKYNETTGRLLPQEASTFQQYIEDDREEDIDENTIKIF